MFAIAWFFGTTGIACDLLVDRAVRGSEVLASKYVGLRLCWVSFWSPTQAGRQLGKARASRSP